MPSDESGVLVEAASARGPRGPIRMSAGTTASPHTVMSAPATVVTTGEEAFDAKMTSIAA
jgi:hypothetical protein